MTTYSFGCADVPNPVLCKLIKQSDIFIMSNSNSANTRVPFNTRFDNLINFYPELNNPIKYVIVEGIPWNYLEEFANKDQDLVLAEEGTNADMVRRLGMKLKIFNESQSSFRATVLGWVKNNELNKLRNFYTEGQIITLQSLV